MACGYLDKSSDRIKLVDVFDDFCGIVVVTLDENSGKRLVKSDPTTQHGHQVLVSHLHDLYELRKDWMLVDGDDRNDGPQIGNRLCCRNTAGTSTVA